MSDEVKRANIPSMSVEEVVTKLTDAFCAIDRQNLPMKAFPSVMLWGPPGVGKSQAVRQIARNLEERTQKKLNVTEVRLLLFNPIDLRGIPTSNADKTLAVWLKPQIFQMDDSPDVINILFLDEISAAPPSVQAAAYQITLDRTVGEHRLPDNCIVIAAGNRTTDRSVAYKMPKALSNRLMHLEVSESFDSWEKWALQNGVNEKVLGFLSFKRDYLMDFHDSTDDLAFATPRSWEMVSDILNHVSDDIDEMAPLISGLVGSGIAAEFRTWAKVYQYLPDVNDIFEGKEAAVPKNADAMYALVSAMKAYAGEHSDEMGKIANSIRYAMRLPPEFAAVLLKGYMSMEEGYKEKLMVVPEFSEWLRTRGVLLNGVV